MKRITFLWATAILLVFTTAVTVAQTTNSYELTWLAFDSSGTVSGGQYQVAATLGQLDNRPLSGGDYTVEGRFGIGGETTATPTAMPTPTATPVVGNPATPTPPPTNRQNLLYLPIVSKK